jgi:hypothetical protein
MLKGTFCWIINSCLLRPIKAKELIEPAAQKLDLPASMIKDIMDFYWQEVRRSMSGMKYPRIHLTNLGDFVVKDWKLEDRIKRIELFDQKNKQKGLQLINARFKTAETLYDLRQVKKQIELESQRAEFIRLHKKTVNETKQHNSDLEEQGTDHGGDQE